MRTRLCLNCHQRQEPIAGSANQLADLLPPANEADNALFKYSYGPVSGDCQPFLATVISALVVTPQLARTKDTMRQLMRHLAMMVEHCGATP